MDIGKSFSYQFEDNQWISKLGVGALISLVPILNLAVTGYMVAIIRNVAAGAGEALPAWDGVGQKFRDGLLVALAGLVYAAPMLILVGVPLTMLAFSGIASQNGDWQSLSRTLAGASGVLLACVLCVAVFYALLLSILHPLILVLFSREGTFASCFKVHEMTRLMSENGDPYFTTWIVTIVGGFAIGLTVGFINLVVGWIPCLGWIVGLLLGLGADLYIITVNGHLYGQFRNVAFGRVIDTPLLRAV